MWFESVFGEFEEKRPFAFVCDGVPSADLTARWERSEELLALPGDAEAKRVLWRDAATGLAAWCDVRRFPGFPAIEWTLWFENRGDEDSPLVEDVFPLDLTLAAPIHPMASYVLHRTRGAAGAASDFEMSSTVLAGNETATLQACGGLPSVRDLPFCRVDTERGAAVVAVGWTGQWKADLACRGGQELRLRAGMETTCFRLRPGEKVRAPRILVMLWEGDSEESHSRFRRLLSAHYLPRRGESEPLPALCQCAPDGGELPGREAVLPPGAAPECCTEEGAALPPEWVATGSALAEEGPDWLLRPPKGEGPLLMDLGRPEARERYVEAAEAQMPSSGEAAWRLDFGPPPLDWWRGNDAPDRQGVTEMKYVAGLYECWDRLVAKAPGRFRAACAGAGGRLDLETVSRFHAMLKSDYRFHDVPDQAALFSLSQYLPNAALMAALGRTDDYAFHSALPASLCLCPGAGGADFDSGRAEALLARYREVRPLLAGDWRPLTKYNRDHEGWLASQYHRADMGEGMVLAFRREDCSAPELAVQLRGLEEGTRYALESWAAGGLGEKTAAELAAGLRVSVPAAPGSDVIRYRKA